jgi:hypothetical protein
MHAGICHACGHDPHAHADRDTEIRLPGLPAKLPPLNLQRLLPAKILRLFVGQEFLGISVRVHGL